MESAGTPGADVHGPWDQSYEGYIFEGDMLAIPEAPEPVTSEPLPLE